MCVVNKSPIFYIALVLRTRADLQRGTNTFSKVQQSPTPLHPFSDKESHIVCVYSKIQTRIARKNILESWSPVGPKILKISLCMSQQSVYSNRCMAWYNATGKENDKSLYETPTIDRCIFCGDHGKIKCNMTIVFSEFETNTGPMCTRCYHANSRKALLK